MVERELSSPISRQQFQHESVSILSDSVIKTHRSEVSRRPDRVEGSIFVYVIVDSMCDRDEPFIVGFELSAGAIQHEYVAAI